MRCTASDRCLVSTLKDTLFKVIDFSDDLCLGDSLGHDAEEDAVVGGVELAVCELVQVLVDFIEEVLVPLLFVESPGARVFLLRRTLVVDRVHVLLLNEELLARVEQYREDDLEGLQSLQHLDHVQLALDLLAGLLVVVVGLEPGRLAQAFVAPQAEAPAEILQGNPKAVPELLSVDDQREQVVQVSIRQLLR